MRGLTVLLTLILGFATIPASAAEPVVITHLAYSKAGNVDIFMDWLEQAAQGFEKQHPNVKVELMLGDQTKFQTMVASGVAPDVMQLPDFDHWGALGFYADLKPLMDRDGIQRLIHKDVYNKLVSNGKIYTAPQDIVSTPTYFNRDLFDQAGMESPDRMGDRWTWSAFLDAGKRLTVDRNGDGNPEIYGIDRPWGGWRLAVGQAGGAFYEFSEKGQPIKSLWNTPQVLAGIEYVSKMYRNQSTPHLRPGVDQNLFRFETGKIALDAVDGLGTLGKLKDTAFNWDFSLQPAGPAGPLGSGGISGPHVMASTQHLNEVWEWVKFYCLNREMVEKFAYATAKIPALLVAQKVWPQAAGVQDKNYQMVLQQSLHQVPASWSVSEDLSPRKIGFNPVWLGEVPAAAYLETIHNKMMAIIGETLK